MNPGEDSVIAVRDRKGRGALAWLAAQPDISSALVGPETIDELEANATAGTISLPAELLERIGSISA